MSKPTYALTQKASYPAYVSSNQYTYELGKIKHAVDMNTVVTAGSAYYVSKRIEEASEQVNSAIYESTIEITSRMDKVSSGIELLQSNFDISMGKVLIQLEMNNKIMKKGFNALINLMKNKRKVEASEHFTDAAQFYENGCKYLDKPQWFKDALKHLLLSVDIFEMNPMAHLYIGHIYHYQPEFMDLELADYHYKLCAMYGEANKDSLHIAGQGYFYAGWLSAVKNNYEEAINLTKTAIDLSPNLAEAYYNLAKYYAVEGNYDESCKHLAKAIFDFDPDYGLKYFIDMDFESRIDEIGVYLMEYADRYNSKLMSAIVSKKYSQYVQDCTNYDNKILSESIEALKPNLDSISKFRLYHLLNQYVAAQNKVKHIVLSKISEAESKIQSIVDFTSNYTHENLNERKFASSRYASIQKKFESNPESSADEVIEMCDRWMERFGTPYECWPTIVNNKHSRIYRIKHSLEGYCFVCEDELGFFEKMLNNGMLCNKHRGYNFCVWCDKELHGRDVRNLYCEDHTKTLKQNCR